MSSHKKIETERALVSKVARFSRCGIHESRGELQTILRGNAQPLKPGKARFPGLMETPHMAGQVGG